MCFPNQNDYVPYFPVWFVSLYKFVKLLQFPIAVYKYSTDTSFEMFISLWYLILISDFHKFVHDRNLILPTTCSL